MKIKKRCSSNVALCIVSFLFTILIILFNTAFTYALTLAVVPDTQATIIGSRVEINLVVSDIPYNRAVYDYGFALAYDSSVLSFYNGISHDPMASNGLNSNGRITPIDGIAPYGSFPGCDKQIDFVGIFDYTAAGLIDLQPHTFTLATFIFDTISPRTTFLHLFGKIEEFEGPYQGSSNPYGNSLGYVTLQDGSVSVVPGPAAVPEPSTMLLLGLGLVGVAGLRKRFRA